MSTEKNTANSIKNYKFENISEEEGKSIEQIKILLKEAGMKDNIFDKFIIKNINKIREYIKTDPGDEKQYYDNMNDFSKRAAQSILNEVLLNKGIKHESLTTEFFQKIGRFCLKTIDKKDFIEEKEVKYAKKPEILEMKNFPQDNLINRKKSYAGRDFYRYNVSGIGQNCGFNALDVPREFALKNKKVRKALKEMFYIDPFSNQRISELEAIEKKNTPITGLNLCFIGRYCLGARLQLIVAPNNQINSPPIDDGKTNELPNLYFYNSGAHYEILVPVEPSEENILLRSYALMKENLSHLPFNESKKYEFEKKQFTNNGNGGWLKSYVDWVKYNRYKESNLK